MFPVITNMLVPSLATPLCPQIPPPMASVAHATTLEGLLNLHADHPTMIITAVAEVSGIRHVNNPVHESQSTTFFLHQRSKSQSCIEVAFRSTRQLVAPVSTFSEKIKCFLGLPPINASKKSDRDARSTTGVPMIPTGLMLPHGRPEGTAGRCQCATKYMLPVSALSA